MRLYECYGKILLQRIGVPIPKGIICGTPGEAEKAASEIKSPVVVKAQLLAPGRGKKGAIIFAETAEEAGKAAESLLGKRYGVETCEKVLVEQKLDIASELYAAAMIDTSKRDVLLILSASGGVNIEQVFAEDPEAVVQYHHDPLKMFHPYQGRKLAKQMGLSGKTITSAGNVIAALASAIQKLDARLVEINPLVVTAENKAIAADAIVQIDEDAVFRHRELAELGIEMEEERPRPPTPREIEAQTFDKIDYRGVVHYQDLYEDGEIGVVSVGSGFSITLLDVLSNYGLKPVNFCDCSGSPMASKVANAFRLVLGIPNIKGALFMSGVVTQDLAETARGIVQAVEDVKPTIPIVVKLAGNKDREAYDILKEAGLEYVFPREAHIEDCIEKLKELVAANPGQQSGGGH